MTDKNYSDKAYKEVTFVIPNRALRKCQVENLPKRGESVILHPLDDEEESKARRVWAVEQVITEYHSTQSNNAKGEILRTSYTIYLVEGMPRID